MDFSFLCLCNYRIIGTDKSDIHWTLTVNTKGPPLPLYMNLFMRSEANPFSFVLRVSRQQQSTNSPNNSIIAIITILIVNDASSSTSKRIFRPCRISCVWWTSNNTPYRWYLERIWALSIFAIVCPSQNNTCSFDRVPTITIIGECVFVFAKRITQISARNTLHSRNNVWVLTPHQPYSYRLCSMFFVCLCEIDTDTTQILFFFSAQKPKAQVWRICFHQNPNVCEAQIYNMGCERQSSFAKPKLNHILIHRTKAHKYVGECILYRFEVDLKLDVQQQQQQQWSNIACSVLLELDVFQIIGERKRRRRRWGMSMICLPCKVECGYFRVAFRHGECCFRCCLQCHVVVDCVKIYIRIDKGFNQILSALLHALLRVCATRNYILIVIIR